MAELILSNKEIENIMKIVKSFEELSLLIKSISKTIENETKKQKGGFLSMLLGTLAANFFGKMLLGKAKIFGQGVLRSDAGTIFSRSEFLIPPHSFTDF